MASIVGKKRGRATYYYLVESARVGGKPRIVSQEYLGTAEEVMGKLSGQPGGEPARSQHKRFGDLAAVWSVLQRLDVAGTIDRVVPRRPHAGASIGTYLALATANRVVAPCETQERGCRALEMPPPAGGGMSEARAANHRSNAPQSN